MTKNPALILLLLFSVVSTELVNVSWVNVVPPQVSALFNGIFGDLSVTRITLALPLAAVVGVAIVVLLNKKKQE